MCSQVDNQKAILAKDRAAPNITANVRFYFEFLVSMFLKREDLVPRAEQSWLRRVARSITEDVWFNRLVMSIVLVNIVIMAMYHANMSDAFADALEVRPTFTIFTIARSPFSTPLQTPFSTTFLTPLLTPFSASSPPPPDDGAAGRCSSNLGVVGGAPMVETALATVSCVGQRLCHDACSGSSSLVTLTRRLPLLV